MDFVWSGRTSPRVTDFPVTRSRSREVDVSALHVSADQLHPQLVTNINAFGPARQQAFSMRFQDTNKSSIRRHAGHDPVKHLADSAAHHLRGDTLRHFALNLARRIFFLSA